MAARAAADPRVSQVRILTPDKDLGQCLAGERVVQVDRMRSRTITEESQLRDKGLAPASVPDFLALVGDTADGIPGFAGWGEKGAAEVLREYGRLEQIPRSFREWKVRPRGGERMAAALAAEPEVAKLYRTLATLRTDVPLREGVADLEFGGVPREEFGAWCASVGASLAGRVKRWR
jgi:5'-3' exonuclease